MAMLRMLSHDLHRTMDPTVDTGGLMQDAPTIHAYSSLNALLKVRAEGGAKTSLDGVRQLNGAPLYC
jgi:hypothetical protein